MGIAYKSYTILDLSNTPVADLFKPFEIYDIDNQLFDKASSLEGAKHIIDTHIESQQNKRSTKKLAANTYQLKYGIIDDPTRRNEGIDARFQITVIERAAADLTSPSIIDTAVYYTILDAIAERDFLVEEEKKRQRLYQNKVKKCRALFL